MNVPLPISNFLIDFAHDFIFLLKIHVIVIANRNIGCIFNKLQILKSPCPLLCIKSVAFLRHGELENGFMVPYLNFKSLKFVITFRNGV